ERTLWVRWWLSAGVEVGPAISASVGGWPKAAHFSRFVYAHLVFIGLNCFHKGIRTKRPPRGRPGQRRRASAVALRAQHQPRLLIRLQHRRKLRREAGVKLLDPRREQGGDEGVVLGLAHL